MSEKKLTITGKVETKAGRSYISAPLSNNTNWQPLLHFTFESSIDYGFVGGTYYVKGQKAFSLNELNDISLMPSFCYTRIFPQQFGDDWVHSCMYVKMPLMCVQTGSKAYGLAFEPYINLKNGARMPLAFAFSSDGTRTTLKLGVMNNFEVHKRSEEEFIRWFDPFVTLESYRKSYDFTDETAAFSIKEYEVEGSWLDIVQMYLKEQNFETLGAEEVQSEFHFTKVLSWLYSVFEPKTGIFIGNKSRDDPGFKGYRSLPTYNTLVVDLYNLSKITNNPKLQEMERKTKDLLLHPKASFLFSDGRVWHNTLHYYRYKKKPLFSSHLGTGLAGYPGGQATVLRALLERIKRGDDDKRLIDITKEGLTWLVNNLNPDGHWNRVHYIFKETTGIELETGSNSYSTGGNAEGVLALLLAYEAFNGLSYLEKGMLALDWVNQFAENSVLTSGYLRDNKQIEPDGVSAIFALQANVKAYELTGKEEYLDYACKFAWYMITWQRWWDIPSFDTLVFSFTPRIAPCETVWAAEAYLDLYRITGDELWLRFSQIAFNAINYENKFEGYSEAIYYDENLKLYELNFECVYTASAVLKYLIKLCEGKIPRFEIKKGEFFRECYPSTGEQLRWWVKRIVRAPFRLVGIR